MPSIAMMVFISIYGIVDGVFVSNFAGELPFAALNLIFPLIMILGSVGFMLGTGGNAVVSKALGEGDEKRANRIFSMLVYTTIVVGLAWSVGGMLVARPVAKLFAAAEKKLSGEILEVFEKTRACGCDLFGVRDMLVKYKKRSLHHRADTLLDELIPEIKVTFRNVR